MLSSFFLFACKTWAHQTLISKSLHDIYMAYMTFQTKQMPQNQNCACEQLRLEPVILHLIL